MSDVKVVRYQLAHNAPLQLLVPVAQVIAGVLPQDTPLPALGITHVSNLRRQNVAGTGRRYCVARVQVTVMAASYPDIDVLLALVRVAVPRSRGVVNGIDVDYILEDVEGPDFGDPDAGIAMRTIDFIVAFYTNV